jgi:hypothetical protein
MKLNTTIKVSVVETMTDLVETDPEDIYTTRPREDQSSLIDIAQEGLDT